MSHKLLNEKHTHTHTKAQEGSCEFGFIWGVTEGHGLGDILSHSSVELLLELSRAEPYSPKYKVPSMSPEEKLKSPRAPWVTNSVSDAHSWVALQIPLTATRGKKLTARWPDCSHDRNCSILSNTGSVASTVLRAGLKRMGLTLLLMIIYIFVSIKIIIACSACICKRATTTVGKEMPQTCVNSFHSKNTVSFVSMKSYRRRTFTHDPIEVEWRSDKWGFVSSF